MASAAAVPKLSAAQQGRLRIASASRDTKRMHTILAEMLQHWPNDSAIQNDEAYTRLLLMPNDALDSEQLITIERLAVHLVEANPMSLPHRTLLGLARLKQGHAAAALEAFENVRVVPEALTPSALTVHAAILSANGRFDDARTEIKQAPVERLLPEENASTANLRD